MLRVARRTDERGYPRSLPEPLRTRLVTAWVVAATAVGSIVPIYTWAAAGSAWWGIALAAVVSVAAGVAMGLAFARRDRDVALPTPIAAGVAAFFVALGTPFLLGGLYLVIALMLTHTGQ